MSAVDLLCSPNAHTRPIVFLNWRCSSKRAVGDQSALAPKGNEACKEMIDRRCSFTRARLRLIGLPLKKDSRCESV
jgi:hypothetical protein